MGWGWGRGAGGAKGRGRRGGGARGGGRRALLYNFFCLVGSSTYPPTRPRGPLQHPRRSRHSGDVILVPNVNTEQFCDAHPSPSSLSPDALPRRCICSTRPKFRFFFRFLFSKPVICAFSFSRNFFIPAVSSSQMSFRIAGTYSNRIFTSFFFSLYIAESPATPPVLFQDSFKLT